jgi:hypothetical protein
VSKLPQPLQVAIPNGVQPAGNAAKSWGGGLPVAVVDEALWPKTCG